MRHCYFFIIVLILGFASVPVSLSAQCDPDGVWLERQAYTSTSGLMLGLTGCVRQAKVITPLQVSNDTLRLINGGTIGYVLTWNGTIWIPAASTGADNWGTQVVQRDSSLQGNGTTASPLGIKGYGAASNGQVPSKSAGGITWIDVGTSTTDLSYTGATSPVTLNSSTGADVTITAGAGIGLAATATDLTITNTDPDQSITNENLTISDGTDSENLGGQTLTVTGAGIATVDYVPVTNTLTINAVEVDGSITNEGSLTVGAGGANTSTIVSNTSASTPVTISGSNTILVTESGSTITLQGDTSLLATVNDINVARNRDDSTWVKFNGSYLNKRITDNVYRYGTTSLRSNDTSGILNIYAQAQPKAAIYTRYSDATSNGFLFFQLDPDGQTNNSTLGNFNFWGQNFDGINAPYSTRANHVWRFGYNTGSGGGRIISTDADLHVAFESNFYNVFHKGGRRRSWEWHIQSQDTIGGVHRMITARGSHDGTNGDLGLNADLISFTDYGGTQKGWLSFTYGTYTKGLTFSDTAIIQFGKPQAGVDLIRARNAANSAYFALIGTDASDRLVITRQGNDIYTYAPNFIFNTIGTITTADGNPVQIGNSTYKSYPSIYAPASQVLQLRSNTGGADLWNAFVVADNFYWTRPDGAAFLTAYETAPSIILANSRMGIGVSPSQTLHVAGSARVTGSYIDSNNDAGSSGQVLSSTVTGTDWTSIQSVSAFTRTMPTTVNDVVWLGVLNKPGNGATNFQLDIHIQGGSVSIGKTYIVTSSYNSTSNTWQILLPAASTGAFNSSDFEVEIRGNNNLDSLRIRRTLGTASCTAYCEIRWANGGTNTFTSISTTNTPPTISATFAEGAIAQVDNKVGINTIAPVRTFDNNGETRLRDVVTDTPTKILGVDGDGDVDTVGIGAEAELHLTNGTLGTNFHTTISPSSLTAGMTNNWNPTGLATAWIIRMSGDDKFEIITGITAPSFAKRLILHNTGANAMLLATENTSSTAGNRFSFGRDVIVFGGKSVEIIYDVTTARWRLLSKAGLYDDVENQYFNTAFQAPVSLTTAEHDFWEISSTGAATAVTPTNGLLRGVSVNTGTSSTGCGDVASKEQFVSINTVDGAATWGYVKAKIVTPSSLSNGTNDYALRIGFLAGECGSDLVEGAYFYYNHSINSGAWSCYTQNAGSSQNNNSGVTVAASTIYVLEVVYRPNISVEFFINGTRVATNDTNVPDSDAMKVLSEIEKQGGTAQRDLQVYLLQTSIAHVN